MGRRGVLVLGALGASAALTSCTGSDATPPAAPPTPGPDELAVRRAAATEDALRQATTTLAGSRPTQATLLKRITAVHQAQVTALGGAAPAASATPSPSATLEVPGSLNSLVTAEWSAARVALHDGEVADDPAVALLLVRVAAARATGADLLATATEQKQHGPLTPSPAVGGGGGAETGAGSGAGAATTGAGSGAGSSVGATATPTATGDNSAGVEELDRLLAGQHAALFGYPLVIARTTGARRKLAVALWAAHREERDLLESAILAAGRTPTPAEPAYETGTPPASNAQAVALAARIERGLTALAADVVAAATGGTRVLGAAQLVLGARRTAAWTGRPVELISS